MWKVFEMELTRDELKEIITEAIKEHSCVLNSETVELLNDPENRRVIRTITEGLSPNSASMLARLGRIIDQVEFTLGMLIVRVLIIGVLWFVVRLAFKKSGITVGE